MAACEVAHVERDQAPRVGSPPTKEAPKLSRKPSFTRQNSMEIADMLRDSIVNSPKSPGDNEGEPKFVRPARRRPSGVFGGSDPNAREKGMERRNSMTDFANALRAQHAVECLKIKLDKTEEKGTLTNVTLTSLKGIATTKVSHLVFDKCIFKPLKANGVWAMPEFVRTVEFKECTFPEEKNQIMVNFFSIKNVTAVIFDTCSLPGANFERFAKLQSLQLYDCAIGMDNKRYLLNEGRDKLRHLWVLDDCD
jgi:hypothetical protein